MQKEIIQIELDFFGFIENWFSNKKDSQGVSLEGTSFLSKIHPLYRGVFEYQMQKLKFGQVSSCLEIKVSFNEFGDYSLVCATISREEHSYKVIINCLVEECETEVTEAYLEGIVEEQELVEVNDVVLNTIIDLVDDSRYLAVKKIPNVFFCKKNGEKLIQKFFTKFFDLIGITNTDKFTVDGKVLSSELLITLKGDSLRDSQKGAYIFKELNKYLKIVLDELGGRIMSSSNGAFTLCLPINIKESINS